MTAVFAAIDVGASNGRVITGAFDGDQVRLDQAHRFPNIPIRDRGRLCWDVRTLFANILDGVRYAGRGTRLASIGVDGWAVDYALLNDRGELIGLPVHYRDERTAASIRRVRNRLSPTELYRRTGIQFLPFNTLYQVVADAQSPDLASAATLLLIPDLFVYWLTHRLSAERTNASTTQLLDARTGEWATDLMREVGIRPEIFPALVDAGELCDDMVRSALESTGLSGPVPVVTVGSHDTASAVAAVPARGPDFAYIATGTWSLAGVELEQPILTEESRVANFTNELGIDGTVRYLRNVMGLWLLQETVRAWTDGGEGRNVEQLLAAAGRASSLAALIDVDDPVFMAPGDMPVRIANWCHRTQQTPPRDRPATVRCILDSLALAHALAIADARRISARDVEVVHVVGGGARNALLCQLTADACGLPVDAGPVEAAALGNILVQARAAGVLNGGLARLRAAARSAEHVQRYEPSGDRQSWRDAARRIGRSLS